jgi:hypothetical protein
MVLESFCKICNTKSVEFLRSLVLKKFDVTYFKCPSCGFIQTENPYWLKEAYGSAITQLDIGLVSRNLYYSNLLESFYDRGLFNDKGVYLDYAGGYGLFVRLMRDKGFDFYRQDVYCENIFANHFDLNDLQKKIKFDGVTAFEVFEHLVDPLVGIREMFEYGDILIFSTELQPEGFLTPESWWYFTPETGQHISFFSTESLLRIAELEKINLYSNNHNLHIFSRHPLPFDPFENPKTSFIHKLEKRIYNKFFLRKRKQSRESLLLKDFNFIKGKI